MGLIIYPLPNANTFANVQIATQVTQEYFPEKAVEWDALSDVQKEAGLLQSYMYMTTCKGLKIPKDYGHVDSMVSSDFILAQVFLTIGRMGQSVFDIDGNTRAITSETVDTLSVTYDIKYKRADSDAPAMYYQLMSKYGCTGGNGAGFSQSYTGRS